MELLGVKPKESFLFGEYVQEKRPNLKDNGHRKACR